MRQGIRSEIASSGAITFGGSGIAAFMRVTAEIIVARNVSAADYGVFGLCLSVVAIIQEMVGGGARMVIQRYGAISFERWGKTAVRSLLVKTATVVAGLSGVTWFALLLLGPWLGEVVGEPRVGDETAGFAVLVPLFALLYLVADYFRATRRTQAFILIRDVVPSAALLLGVLPLFIFSPVRLSSVWWAYLFSLVVTLAAAALWEQRSRNGDKPVDRCNGNNAAQNESSRSTIVCYAVASTIVGVLWIVRERVALFVVSDNFSSDSVALFFVAARFLIVASLIKAAVNALLSPRIASLHAAGAQDDMREYYQTATRWLLGFTIPMAVFLAIASEYIVVTLYGDPYASAGVLVALVLMFYIISVAAGPANLALQVSGHPNLESAILVGSILLMIVATSELAERYGLIGAVIGCYGASSLADVVRACVVRRVLGIWPLATRHMSAIGIGVVICATSAMSNQSTSFASAYSVLVAAFFASAVGALGCWLLLDGDERRWLCARLRAMTQREN